MVARHFGTLALIAVGVFALVSDLRPSVSGNAGLIGGPYSYLLASSTDLGPSHRADTQLTAALRDSTRPDALFGWADDNGLAVRWRPGEAWAVVEGAAENVAKAFDVEVHDYQGQRGQVFYASPQQPSIPESLRDEVAEFGRILGYTPHHTSRPSILPLDVPDRGLTPGGVADHLQRQQVGRRRLHRQGHHDRLLRVRRLRAGRPRHLRHHLQTAEVHPDRGRRAAGRSAR